MLDIKIDVKATQRALNDYKISAKQCLHCVDYKLSR